jgi:hypothetical protein
MILIFFSLKVLNLSKNDIYSVPHLQLVDGRHMTESVLGKKWQKGEKERTEIIKIKRSRCYNHASHRERGK